MPWVNCLVCDKNFYAKPRHLKIGWGKYCSDNCKFIAQRKGKIVDCANCGKKIYRIPADFADSKSGLFFCNKSCHCSWMNKTLHLGTNHPQWNYGEASYKQSFFRNYTKERKCIRCGNKEERVLVIHHKDKNRKNNLIENLELLCRNCHYLRHEYNE
jgi:hypothetical protein